MLLLIMIGLIIISGWPGSAKPGLVWALLHEAN